MSATLNFARLAILQKLGHTGDSIVQWYASHDPGTASEAEIAQLGERVGELEHRIAEIQGKLDHDQHELDGLMAKLDRDRKIATVLGERIKAAQASNSAAEVTQSTAQLTAVLGEIKQLAGQDMTCKTDGRIFLAQTTIDTETATLTQFREAHQNAVNDWTTARSRLDQAQSSMEAAHQQRQLAEEQAAQADRDANLLHRPQAGSVALSAMEHAAQADQTAARAASLHASTLKQAGGGDVDSIAKSVLNDEKRGSATENALADLERLTGGH